LTINSIVSDYRKLIDEYYFDADKGINVQGSCQYEAKELANTLNSHGIDAVSVAGYYKDIDEDYSPDVDQWDSRDVEMYNQEVEKYSKPLKMPHWWVVVDGKIIIDVTADQFHPSNKDENKVIITSINDKRYS
jgi:hypothetical protein